MKMKIKVKEKNEQSPLLSLLTDNRNKSIHSAVSNIQV